MRFMKQASSRFVLVYALALGASAALCLVPWSVVATTASADEAKPKEAIIKGKFVSFKDGVLQVKVKDEPSDVVTNSEWKVAEDTKVVSHIRGESKEGIAREAFKLWEPEAVIAVKLNDGKVTLVELGIKKTTDRIPDRVPDKTPDKAADKSPDRLPEKTPDKKGDKASQKPKFEHGRFVSIKNGTLTIEANSGDLVENKVPPNTKTLVWDAAADKYLPADTASTLKQVKVGTPTVVNVDKESITLRFGSRKGKTTGTFVSYKNDRLLILGIFPEPNSFTKKYGNNVHFNKFREDVPAYESVDGGEYELIGMANKVLGDVKEGTLVTVHAEGDDNITLVQIGVPKKK